jgi:ribokinase
MKGREALDRQRARRAPRAQSHMRSAASIAVLGSYNTDLIVGLERLPRPGETILGGQFHTAAGGKGANQAVAAARAGGRISFIARVGRDSFGDRAIAALRDDGIGVSHVSRDSRTPSGVALILVDQKGENSIAVASGANAGLAVSHVRQARQAIETAAILLETPLPSVEAAVRIAARCGTRVILNPAPARKLTDALLRRVSILTPNESEAEMLTGIRQNGIAAAEKAALQLRRRGVPTVIVTLGAQGALVASDTGTALVRAFKVKAADTTAAGDTFNGALAVALTEGHSLEKAVQFANAAAAISVTRLGAQTSAPTRKSIDAFLRRCVRT